MKAKEVKELLKRNEISYTRLADALGIAESTVFRRLKYNHREVPIETIQDIADAIAQIDSERYEQAKADMERIQAEVKAWQDNRHSTEN